jgi:hypothetical protein
MYGLFLLLLFLGLGLHYILLADASVRSKAIVGGLMAVYLLFGLWMAWYVSLAIQVLVGVYVLMFYRLQGASPD